MQQHKTFKILCIDDCMEDIILYQEYSKEAQYPIEIIPFIFCNSESKETLLEDYNEEIDIVVVDYNLSAWSGVELIKEIKEKNPHQFCVLVSGTNKKFIANMFVEVNEDSSIVNYIFSKPLLTSNWNTLIQEYKKYVQ